MKTSIILTVIFLLLNSCSAERCPVMCRCDRDRSNLRRVVCEQGGLKYRPTNDMEDDIEVLRITGGPNGQNDFTIGPIFNRFRFLRELVITDSNIPRIGDHTFKGLHFLKLLDLSRNKLTSIGPKELSPLSRTIEEIRLDENEIFLISSGTFFNMTSLKRLSLAKNKIELGPKMFYLVPNLETFDLSSNDLKQIEPAHFSGLGNLKRLILRNCNLDNLNINVYLQLRHLVELDLRDNQFVVLGSKKFRYLKYLEVLRLDGNKLTLISENAFYGHNLNILGLSNNRLNYLFYKSVYNLTVKELDISGNQLSRLEVIFFGNLLTRLEALKMGNINLNQENIKSILEVLPNLRNLSLAGSTFTDIRPDLFLKQQELNFLDLSDNHLSSIDPKVFDPLINLRILNLSNNLFYGLKTPLTSKLDDLRLLRKVILSGNPIRCDLCFIRPLFNWVNTSKVFRGKNCNYGPDYCTRCTLPKRLSGRDIQLLKMDELQYCESPDAQASILTQESQIGIFVAVAICVIIIAIIIINVLMYHHHGSYYTHEEDRESTYINEAGIYDDASAGSRNGNYTKDKVLISSSYGNNVTKH